MRVALEIAVTTPEEAVASVRAGADRLELCAALEVGGVTPSLGVFTRVRELVAVPVMVLLRPRPGGFVYSDDEFASILLDAGTFRQAGADGLVFGALDHSGRLATDQCRRIVELAAGQATFHRAFDEAAQRREALEEVIALGFSRVLTSGGAATASEGIPVLADLAGRAAGRITILPGGGVRPENCGAILLGTGCRELHSAARAPGGTAADPRIVAALRNELDRPPSLR